jgi:hypothetical protein
MLSLIPMFNIKVLTENDNTRHLSNLYITNNIIPRQYILDASHIALATVYNLNKIISLNFKHIVRDKTKNFTDYINKIHGYHSIEINSPMEVIDYEETEHYRR